MAQTRTADELILTGHAEAVDRLLKDARPNGNGLIENGSMQVDHKDRRTLKVSLVKTPNEARGVSHQLAAWAKAAGVAVRAEPNCAIGHPFRIEKAARGFALDPWEWQENPWEWQENPWEWQENPWEWQEGPSLPIVVAAGSTPAEGAGLFWGQSAFRKIGLTDASGQRIAVLGGRTGQGVHVGLFDALPSVKEKEIVYPAWLTPHPAKVAQEGKWDDRDISDHGLMTASLVNAVAPGAQVHLYEVAGPDGHGRLFPLLEAISDFMAVANGQPAVISLSLGSLCSVGSYALRALLQKATDSGMVVCAAAGNLSHCTPKVSALLPAQVPAIFPNVIAVSASNMSDQRATYSQRGDIAAPGGEDLGRHGPDDVEDIIGLGVAVGSSGYVRMDAGTSFATPLVAGAAALLLQGQANRDALTYTRILAALRAGATHGPAVSEETLSNSGLGAGILNLTNIQAI